MQHRRVVILEIDPDVLELLRIIAQDLAGVCKVATATDAEQAQELVEELKPHVVLLDLLPETPGLDVFRWLKANDETKSIPAIAMVWRSEVAEEALTLGFDDCIVKPFDVDLLVDKLRPYLP